MSNFHSKIFTVALVSCCMTLTQIESIKIRSRKDSDTHSDRSNPSERRLSSRSTSSTNSCFDGLYDSTTSLYRKFINRVRGNPQLKTQNCTDNVKASKTKPTEEPVYIIKEINSESIPTVSENKVGPKYNNDFIDNRIFEYFYVGLIKKAFEERNPKLITSLYDAIHKLDNDFDEKNNNFDEKIYIELFGSSDLKASAVYNSLKTSSKSIQEKAMNMLDLLIDEISKIKGSDSINDAETKFTNFFLDKKDEAAFEYEFPATDSPGLKSERLVKFTVHDCIVMCLRFMVYDTINRELYDSKSKKIFNYNEYQKAMKKMIIGGNPTDIDLSEKLVKEKLFQIIDFTKTTDTVTHSKNKNDTMNRLILVIMIEKLQGLPYIYELINKDKEILGQFQCHLTKIAIDKYDNINHQVVYSTENLGSWKISLTLKRDVKINFSTFLGIVNDPRKIIWNDKTLTLKLRSLGYKDEYDYTNSYKTGFNNEKSKLGLRCTDDLRKFGTLNNEMPVLSVGGSEEIIKNSNTPDFSRQHSNFSGNFNLFRTRSTSGRDKIVTTKDYGSSTSFVNSDFSGTTENKIKNQNAKTGIVGQVQCDYHSWIPYTVLNAIHEVVANGNPLKLCECPNPRQDSHDEDSELQFNDRVHPNLYECGVDSFGDMLAGVVVKSEDGTTRNATWGD